MSPTCGTKLFQGGIILLDTISLTSPFLSEEVARKIEDISVQRSGIDFEVGELLYIFTTKDLRGSWDSNIHISVKRDRFESFLNPNTGKNVVVKVDCEPYLKVECSLHKFYLGHNILGGSDSIHYQVSGLIKFLEVEFNVGLPRYCSWTVSRIDYAMVYDLGDNISSFFRGFSNVYYPRRSAHKYGDTGLYFPGTYTTLKLYDKHKEFLKNDRNRLKRFLPETKMVELIEMSKGILRIELEVKSRKLKHMYGNLPTVGDLEINDLRNQYKIELMRIFKMGEDKVKLYNNSSDVEKILFREYGTKGYIYLGTWYRLSVNGYDLVKSAMPKSTFYRHINKLRDVGVSWNHTDVIVSDNDVVEFVFNPFNTSLEVQDDYILKVA